MPSLWVTRSIKLTTARLWCGCMTVPAGLLADALANKALSPACKLMRGVASAGRWAAAGARGCPYG